MPATLLQVIANGANGLEVSEPNPAAGATIAGVVPVPPTKLLIEEIDATNVDDAVVYVNVYNVALASVTPGTTVPIWQGTLQATSVAGRGRTLRVGLYVTAPFCVQASTGADGSGDPTTGVRASVRYGPA